MHRSKIKTVEQLHLNQFVVSSHQPMSSAISLIDAQEADAKFVVVVDDNKKLVGTITDGDVRRGLLNGFGINDSVSQIMFSKPSCCAVDDPVSHIQRVMSTIGSMNPFLPIVDVDGVLVRILIGARDATFNTSALIMAGGFGTRLGEKTKSKPKPLIEVNGQPMLEHVLRNLEKAGVNKIYISTHFLSEQIEEHVRLSGRENDVTILYEKKPLGTAGSIGLLPHGMSGRLIVTNSDVMTDLNYESFINFGTNHENDVSLAVVEHKVFIPFGVVAHGPDGRYSGVVEKPVVTNKILAGIYCFPEKAIDLVELDEKLDMPDFLQRLADRKFLLNLFPLHEYWSDVGTPEDLAKAISKSR